MSMPQHDISNAVNRRLVDGLKESGPLTYLELQRRYAENMSTARFMNKLRHLRDFGHIKTVHVDSVVKWEAVTKLPEQAPVRRRERAIVREHVRKVHVGCSVALPRHVPILSQPDYVPEPDHAAYARPGSGDFRSIPSRGFRT